MKIKELADYILFQLVKRFVKDIERYEELQNKCLKHRIDVEIIIHNQGDITLNFTKFGHKQPFAIGDLITC